MAAFAFDETSWGRLDFQLIRQGGVVLYHAATVLDEDLAWLRGERYQVVEFDCTTWDSQAAFHSDVAEKFDFPRYYGRTFDAFNDSLGDVPVPDDGGLAVVLGRFDSLKPLGIKFMAIVLDIFASATRVNLLYGRRLLVLVQSDDPRIAFDPLGCIMVDWNPREWSANRGL